MNLQADRFKRRSSSIFSVGSSLGENEKLESSKMENLSEMIKNQKIKQYKNLLKLEQLQNPAHVLILNNLQDADLRELFQFIDLYFNNCLKSISSRDSLFKLLNTENSNDDYIIRLESINGVDFLKNGIKSGNPIITQIKTEQKLENLNNSTSTLPKIPETKALSNQSPRSSIVSYTRYSTNQQIQPTVQNQSVLNLNYLLILDFNKKYFKIEQEELNDIYRIILNKQPTICSTYDYEQIGIDIRINKQEDKHDINKKLKNIQKSFSSKYKIRCLNTKALFDRLIRYFNFCLKHEWPLRPKTMTHSNSSSKHQSTNEQPTVNDDEFKKCYLKNNRIIISFKWHGSKALKDVDVNLAIDLGFKIDNEDLGELRTKIDHSILRIINQYLSDNYLELISEEEQFTKLLAWVNSTLNLNLTQIYLQPTFLYLMTLNTKILKLNFLKFLLWFDSLRSFQTGFNSINDLYLLNNQIFKQNVYQIIQNSNSPLFIYFKLTQLFLSTCINTLKEDPINKTNETDLSELSTESFQFDNEDLIINNVLNELNQEGQIWSSDNLLDRIWKNLTHLRSYLFISAKMPDPLNLYSNQLPKFYLKCIGYYTLNDTNTNLEKSNKLLNALKISFEATMKNLISRVVTEEIDFSILEKSNSVDQSIANLTTFDYNDIKNFSNDYSSEIDFSNMATKASKVDSID